MVTSILIFKLAFLDHDSGNDEPQEFLLRGAAAIVELDKQLSRDGSEQEENDQHALVPIYKAFMGPDRNRKPSPSASGSGNQNVRQPHNPIGAHHHLQVYFNINGILYSKSSNSTDLISMVLGIVQFLKLPKFLTIVRVFFEIFVDFQKIFCLKLVVVLG